jgi:hypothetical protein
MGLFNKLNGPVFIKETSDAEEQLAKLNMLYDKADGDVKKLIEQDIKMLNYGLAGEKSIIFELKNSFMPMLILHDLFLEHEDLKAQIDFLVITKKKIFILECKNLFGNIEVNSKGDFIRAIEFNGKRKKEGIYSPITQNQRHMDVLRRIRGDSKSNIISKGLFDLTFEANYKSVVVLANPKTVINMKYAKKDVKESIIRHDQLVNYLKSFNDDKILDSIPDKRMYEIAEEYLSYHKTNEVDYSKKYESLISEQKTNVRTPEVSTPLKIEDTEIYKELKAYRLGKSREENIKAFYIFNNLQMEDLINKMPQNQEDLLKVSGFNKAKCEKYGEEILGIISKYY